MRVVVEADGGSRGNPGPAGYGAVVRDAGSGEVLAERSAGLGVATNNIAEYSGLIAGLQAARELGADQVDVRLDSKLVIEQMSGRWKIRNADLRPLALRAQELVRGFDRVHFEWVPRERNKHADRLANEAMDAQAAGGAAAGDPPEPAAVSAPAEAMTAPPSAWSHATGAPVRLLLVRHGQTEFSLARRYSGRGDPKLTAAGERQAKALAQRLAAVPNVAAVLSSPLTRARDTAKPVAAAIGLPVEVVDALTEVDFGGWEGLTFTEAAGRDPELHRRWLSEPSVATPGGESFDAVYRRVGAALRDITGRYADATVVVVSHVTPIKSILRAALDTGPSVLFRLHLDLASLSVAEFYADGHTSVRLVNDTSHLH